MLHCGHADLLPIEDLNHSISEFLAHLGRLIREELEEKSGHLLWLSVLELDMHVNPAVTNESRVEFLAEVGGQNKDLSVLVGDTVKGIEKPREGDAHFLIAQATISSEKSINVFEHNQSLTRSVVDGVLKCIVCELGICWLHEAQVTPVLRCDGLKQTGLARTRNSKEEVRPLVWDAVLHIEVVSATGQKFVQVLDQLVLGLGGQDHTVH
mmetsp:Transcript_22722/g.35582  ORF Transcript_22722/g.35582 Transcript_22722/m.35582 type:complete len:210 (-) Transcript_22722:765-1394(-)